MDVLVHFRPKLIEYKSKMLFVINGMSRNIVVHLKVASERSEHHTYKSEV